MRALKILSIVSIAGILLLSFFSWYSCDDYCNRIELARYPVLKMAWLQYMNWDGRSLSIATFVQLFSLKYFPVEVTTFLWALSFVATSVLIFKIIQSGNPFFSNGISSIIGIAIVCATMWLGMWKLIPDIIYWATGGSYSLLNLVGIFWLSVFLPGLRRKDFRMIHCIFIFIFSLICGINSHNFIPGLFLIGLFELCYCWFISKEKAASYFITCALTGLLIGAGIVFLSPGNNVRLSIISYSGFSLKFLYFYFLVLAKYIYWLLSLMFLFLFIAWLSGKKFYFQSKRIVTGLKEVVNSFQKKRPAFLLLYQHKYLIAALSTISVFSATPFFAAPRTAIFFATLLIIWFFQNVWKEGRMICPKRFVYGSGFFLCFFIGVILFQMLKAYPVKQELAARERLFRNNKGMDVTVSSISSSRIPFAFTFTDISSDSSYWVNRCTAQYYELKTIRTVSD